MISAEIDKFCDDLIVFCNKHLACSVVKELESSRTFEALEYLGFFYKLIADCYRYKTEHATADLIVENLELCHKNYLKSYGYIKDINGLSEIKLGFILNYSVFLAEHVESIENGIALAKSAVAEANKIIQATNVQPSNKVAELIKMLDANTRMWSAQLK